MCSAYTLMCESVYACIYWIFYQLPRRSKGRLVIILMVDTEYRNWNLIYPKNKLNKMFFIMEYVDYFHNKSVDMPMLNYAQITRGIARFRSRENTKNSP